MRLTFYLILEKKQKIDANQKIHL